jgi:DNA-binding transcriptional LysR family regulator
VLRPDFTTLRLFLSVFNLESISKASEHEHIAPSAISKRIQSFEAEIGTQLFYRHARGVTPTAAGRVLAVHANKLFGDLNRITAELSMFASGEWGEVRIHAHSSAVIQYLPDDIGGFLQRYPKVQILLREETSLDVLQSLADGAADIGILDGNVPIPAGFQQRPYVKDRLVALVPVGHPLAEEPSIDFADIRDSDHVSLETGSSLQILVARAAERHGFQLRTRIEVRTFEAAVRMVEKGLGIAVLPIKVIRLHADPSKVRLVPLTDAWSTRYLVICIKDMHLLTSAARHMLQYLQQRFEDD